MSTITDPAPAAVRRRARGRDRARSWRRRRAGPRSTRRRRCGSRAWARSAAVALAIAVAGRATSSPATSSATRSSAPRSWRASPSSGRSGSGVSLGVKRGAVTVITFVADAGPAWWQRSVRTFSGVSLAVLLLYACWRSTEYATGRSRPRARSPSLEISWFYPVVSMTVGYYFITLHYLAAVAAGRGPAGGRGPARRPPGARRPGRRRGDRGRRSGGWRPSCSRSGRPRSSRWA